MPFLRRRFAPEPAAADRVLYTSTSLLEATLRASAITIRGLVWDATTVPAPRDDGRAYAHVVLSGVLATDDGVFGPGEAAIYPSFAAMHRAGAVALGEPHRAVALRLDGAEVVPRRASCSVDTIAKAYTTIHDEEPLAHAEATDLARALDLEPLVEASNVEEDARVAEALSRVLSGPTGLPSMLDLGMGVSSRQSRRCITSFFRSFRMPFETFREMRLSFTLTTAMLYLARPDVSVERCARAVGLASATSLCHAIAKAELLPPRVARERRARALAAWPK